jgi:PAS domain S-box-containing protein
MLLTLFRGNIRRKLVLLVLAASLPALAVIVHSGMVASREDVDAARRSLAALVDGMALEQERLTASTRNLLASLAALPAFQERDIPQCAATLRLALQANPTYATLHFLDPQGWLLASGQPTAQVNLADRKHFREALASRSFSVGEYTLGRTVSGPILPFGQAVLDGRGEVAGVLVGTLHLEHFRSLFPDRSFPAGASIGMVDWQGLRLFRYPDPEKYPWGEPIHPKLFQALRENENRTFSYLGTDGVERLLASRALRLQDGAEPYLRLTAGVPVETIAAPALQHMYVSLAASAGAALLAAAIAWFLGATVMARSMEALARTARRLEQGDTSARVDIPRLDGEMRVLAEALNSMAEAVRQREADRDQALADMRASEARLRAIADNVPALIAQISADERYLFVNKYYKTCYGVEPESLLGRTVREVLGEASYARVEGHIRRVLGGEAVSAHIELSFQHGLRQCLAHSIPARDPEGRVSSYYLMIHDVTEFKRMEEELRQTARAAQAASEAKSAFLANMSHEIRTPINGLMGMLQLLQGTALDLEQRAHLDCAAASVQRLTRLLSDVLDLSRIEAGKLSLNSASFRPADLRDSLLELFGPAARDKGLDFAVTIHPGVPDALVGDETRLLQVLFNLVGNALKFTTRGRVLVEVSPLPDTPRGEARLLFSVRDTGIGIPEAMIPEVLEPFSQADGSFSRRHQGAGLGLSIVRKLTRLLGGELAIDSTEGQGSDFHLSLRFARPTPATGRPRD